MRSLAEPPEHQLKKYEELYATTKKGLEDQYSRYQRIEEKVARYLSAVTILITILTFVSPTAAELYRDASQASEWAALCALGVFGSLTLLALLCFVWSLSFRGLQHPIMDQGVINHFAGNRYIDVLYSWSVAYTSAITYNEKVIDRKISVANWGFYCLALAMVFLILSVALYALATGNAG